MEEDRLEQASAPQEQPDFDRLLSERRDYQSAFDRKVSQALNTARANWEREQERAMEERTQAIRAEARAQAEESFRQRQQELSERERDFARRVRQVETAELLTRQGLPAGFAPWLTGETGEESQRRVAEFDAAFRSALGNAVRERMAGTVPAEPAVAPALDRDALRQMTPQEINARWSEIQQTLKANH